MGSSFHLLTSETTADPSFSFPVCLIIFYWGIINLQCCISLGAQQSDSDLYTYIDSYTYTKTLFIRLFSCVGHYRVLTRVPCAIQKVLISYLFYV